MRKPTGPEMALGLTTVMLGGFMAGELYNE